MTGIIQTSIVAGKIELHEQLDQPNNAVDNCCGRGGTLRPVAICPKFLRVLIVDDYAESADSLARLVKQWGHIPRVAYNGATVLDMVGDYQPDVVLLDIVMPKMDGFQVAQHLRSQARFTDVLLIAMTGYVDDEHRLQGRDAGFDHHLVKPFDLLALEALLQVQLHRLRQPATGAHPACLHA